MSEHDDNPYHLPLPSAQPLIASFGAAMMLVGLVPDSRLWRMTIISTGAIISGGRGDAESKIAAMEAAGIKVSPSPARLGNTLAELLRR